MSTTTQTARSAEALRAVIDQGAARVAAVPLPPAGARTAYEHGSSGAREALRWAAETFGEDADRRQLHGREVLVHLVGTTIPGRRRVLPRHRLPLRRDPRHPRRRTRRCCRSRSRTILPLPTVAEQDAEYGAKLHDRNPDLCCALRKVEPLERALSAARRVGHRHAPRGRPDPHRHRRSSGWDAKRGMVKLNPLAAWTAGRRRPLRRGERGLREPAAAGGLRLDRLRAVHARRRRRRGPARRPLGREGQDRMRAAHMSTTTLDSRPRRRAGAATRSTSLDHLDHLESEAIHIFREVAGEFERPVILFSGGKDSVVMLHLALKAFAPAPLPFALLHVDTGHNFPEVLEYRDETVERLGLRLRRGPRAGLHRRRPAARASRRHPQPAADRAAARRHRDRQVRRGLRRRPPRRGEGPRQGARVQPARRVRRVGPAPPAPRAVGPLQRPARPRRARPRLPALELDRAGRLAVHRSASASSCRRSTTPTSARCSTATACGSPPAGGAARGPASGRDAAGALPHRRRHDAAPAPSTPTPPTWGR